MTEETLDAPANLPAQRPVIIAIDGRSGAGKTTLALELAALLRGHRKATVFHLEDIYPGWNGLAAGVERYVSTVLTPLSHGATAQWASWDWANHYDGDQRTTAPADVVVVEGVGAAHASARALVDVVVWVEAGPLERKRRALERDGDSFAPHWDEWAAQEDALLAEDDPSATADILVEGRADGTAPAHVLRALATLPALEPLLAPERAARRGLALQHETIGASPAEEQLFAALFGGSERAVWLDSSNAGGGIQGPGRNRFSIMADDGGPYGLLARHRAGTTLVSGGGVSTRIAGPFFRWLDTEWGRRAVRAPEGFECGFTLGWLGYLGYELKRETGGADVRAATDDAQLIFAGRAVVLDHQERCVHLLTLAGSEDRDQDNEWFRRARAAVLGAVPATATADSGDPAPDPEGTGPALGTPRLAPRDSEEDYREKIRRAQAEIREGNSYEVCLTTAFTGTASPTATSRDCWAWYRRLRRDNPAPFAAYLRLGPVSICSSSPERFLRISADGDLRAEPIKGTRPRNLTDPAADAALRHELETSEKEIAENVIIVDLLRNDLSHFAVPDSLAVPRLCAVETYATVHQLVSTIEARLRPGASRAGAVASAFPAGSMTGAPKISTMAILDALEDQPRGIYSGAIGYFSLSGAADLSVTIRTLVAVEEDGGLSVSLGAGGAITADSAPGQEWQEVHTKASGVMAALCPDGPLAIGR